MLSKNSKYEIVNKHNVKTVIRTTGKAVYVENGFSTGYAGTLREFEKFLEDGIERKSIVSVEEVKE